MRQRATKGRSNMAQLIPDELLTDQQAIEFVSILKDPDAIGRLTVEQIQTIDTKLQEWKEDRVRIQDSIPGATPEQKERVRTALAGRQAPPGEQVEEGVRAKDAGIAGLKEGAIRLVEGTLDLAGDLAVTLVSNDPSGVTGDAEEEQQRQQRFEQAVKDNRTERNVRHIEQFGMLPPVWSQLAGEVAPFVLARTPVGATMLGIMTKGAIQGVALGATQFTSGEDSNRLWSAILGGTTGALFPLAFAPKAIRNAAVRGFVRRFNTGNVEQADRIAERVAAMEKSGDFGYSLAQASGDRLALQLEVKTANIATKTAQNKNLNTLGRNLLRISRTMSKNGKNPGAIILSLRDTLKTARDGIYAEARATFGGNMEAVLKHFGDEVVIDGGTYLQKVDDLIMETEDALVSFGGKASKNLRNYRDEIDKVVNPWEAVASVDENNVTTIFMSNKKAPELSFKLPPGAKMADAQNRALQSNNLAGVTPEEAFRLLKGLNKVIGGDTAIFKNAPLHSNRQIARALMGDFLSAMEADAASQAGRAIRSVNGMYKQSMAHAQAIDDLMITTIFGGKKFPKSLDKAMNRLKKQSPEELKATRDFLEEWNPQLLDDLKGTMVRDMVRTARRGSSPAVDTPVDPTKLIANLDGFSGPGQAGRGLFTAEEQSSIKLTSDALRILKNKYFSGAAPGGITAEDLAINVISRSPEFMGRFVTRLLSSGKTMEQALLDPTFRKAMAAISDDTVGRADFNLAVAYIIRRYLVSDEEAQSAQQRRDIHELSVERGVVNP